jgi:hypothetical protein
VKGEKAVKFIKGRMNQKIDALRGLTESLITAPSPVFAKMSHDAMKDFVEFMFEYEKEDEMPMTKKGRKIKRAMTASYGKKRGERVFYASRNAGTIKGVDRKRKK